MNCCCTQNTSWQSYDESNEPVHHNYGLKLVISGKSSKLIVGNQLSVEQFNENLEKNK